MCVHHKVQRNLAIPTLFVTKDFAVKIKFAVIKNPDMDPSKDE